MTTGDGFAIGCFIVFYVAYVAMSIYMVMAPRRRDTKTCEHCGKEFDATCGIYQHLTERNRASYLRHCQEIGHCPKEIFMTDESYRQFIIDRDRHRPKEIDAGPKRCPFCASWMVRL